MLLLLDMLHLWYKRLPVSSGDPSWTVWSVPVAQQILLGLSNFLRIFLEMTSMHSLAAATTVAIGISRPCDWPPMFGRLSDAYSLKRFWGYVVAMIPPIQTNTELNYITAWSGISCCVR